MRRILRFMLGMLLATSQLLAQNTVTGRVTVRTAKLFLFNQKLSDKLQLRLCHKKEIFIKKITIF